MYYSEKHIDEFARELATIPQKRAFLLLAYGNRHYRTGRGKEFALHGFLRRLGTLCHCIDRVFALLPPTLEDVPTNDACVDATIAVQAFIFNVFGCMDNLAWIWVEEKVIRKPDGTPLAQNAVGLGAKYNRVRESFSDEFRAYLQSQTMESWFAHLEGYRHALAHRIPLYIPPYEVSPEHQSEYLALEVQIEAASRADDDTLEADLKRRQRALMFFRPWMVHSFEEQSPVAIIHPQVLADFNTVEEIARRMMSELGQGHGR